MSLHNNFPQEDLVRVLNFKMSAKCFVNVTREQMNVMEKISIPESTRDAIKFGVTLFKIEI